MKNVFNKIFYKKNYCDIRDNSKKINNSKDFFLDEIRVPNINWIDWVIDETDNLILGSCHEDTYLFNKLTKKLLLEDNFYGDAECGLEL